MCTNNNRTSKFLETLIMIYIIIFIWYLIGSLGALWCGYKIYPKITNGDLIFAFTLGGLGGLVTFLIGILFMSDGEWWKKQIF